MKYNIIAQSKKKQKKKQQAYKSDTTADRVVNSFGYIAL